MKRYTPLLMIMFLAACNEAPTITLNKLPGDALILAFGDSLTYGTGASSDHDYPSVLSRLTAIEVINEGVPGEISSDGLKRLPALLDEYQPRLLLLIHGGNDILRKIPAEQTVSNLKQMIAEAKSRQIEVVMLGVPKPNLFALNSANFYQTVAESGDVLADLETLPQILGDNNLKSDLIHPNNAGYEFLAKNIHQLLQNAGAL